MTGSQEAIASLTIESVSVFYQERKNGGTVCLILKNNGPKTVGRGKVLLRTYSSNLVILEEFCEETDFSLSPGEKEEVIAGDWQSPERVHVQSFEEAGSSSIVRIDEWFAGGTRIGSEDGTVEFHRIESPI